MTHPLGRKIAIVALVLLDAGLLLFLGVFLVTVFPDTTPGYAGLLVLLLAALLVPLAVLWHSRGRRVLLAWGLFLATVILAFGTCAAMFARAGLL